MSTKTYIYEVVRWGSDLDQSPDVMFLVRANSVGEAAVVGDAELIHLPGNSLSSFSDCVHEVGVSCVSSGQPTLLRGPYYGRSYTYGGRRWERDRPDGEWVLHEDA